MRYETIIFDLDGTLRENQPHFMDALRDCLKKLDITVDGFQWRLTERWVHRYWAHSPEIIEDVKQYGNDGVWNAFLRRLMSQVGHPPASDEDVAHFAGVLSEHFQPVSQLTPGALETLQALKSTDVVLGVLSNRSNDFSDELDHLGIADYFDFTLAAGEVGHWKPRPEVFWAALERAGHIPAEAALYVGDNYYADIVGATNAGLDSVLVDSRRVFTDVPARRVERIDEILPWLESV
ncbi:MAG: HAD family hydrolase [Chloroflexi bacterium]|nr:HAD family hydrolase [Chloroflexota bacterium]